MPSTVLPWYSLKTRITLATLLIFLLSLWSLSFYATRVLRQDMERISGEQQFSTVTYAASEVQGNLGDRIKALELIAHAIDTSLIDDPAALQKFLDQRFVLHSQFNDGVLAYRTDGTAIASSPFVPERIGVNYLDRDYLVGAIKDGKSTIGRPVIGKTLNAPVFVMAVPIRDAQGKVIGALSGVTNLGKPNFLDKIKESRYGKTGGYLIVDRQHRLIVSATNKARIMEASPAPGIYPEIDRFLNGYEGYSVFVNPLGVEVLQSAKGIPLAGWYLGVSLSSAEAFAPIRDMQQRTLLATALLTLVAGGLTWWLLRRQLAPLVDTARTLAALSAIDEHPQALPIRRPDEIGQLIGGFNRLLEILRKREESLQMSEIRFREIFDEAPTGYHELDSEGRINRVNRTELASLGYSAEEMLGHHVWEFVEQSNVSRQAVLSKLAGNFPPGEILERNFCKKDGTLILMLIQDKPLRDQEGKITGIRTTLVDITKRKQAEKALQDSETKYRLLAENAADWIFWVSPNASFRYSSPASRQISGHSPEEFLAEPDLMARIIHPDDRAVYREHMENVVGPDVDDLDLRIMRPDGEVRWIRHHCVPIYDATGTFAGRQGTNFDITARKKMEAELERHRHHLEELVLSRTAELAQSRDAAEAANRAKSIFLATMSHELRTPMNGIMGMADMVLSRTTDPQQIDWLKKSKESSQHLLAIINNILDVSRAESGQLALEETDFSLSQVIDDTLNAQRESAQAKGLNLSVEIAPDVPDLLRGDASRLRQILINFVGNATKFSEHGKISVRVFVGEADSTSVLLRIEVTDQGVGIGPEDHDRIFKVFTQVDGSSTRKFAGTGLGLIISKRLAMLMSGEVGFESAPGIGSTFWFTARLRRGHGILPASQIAVAYKAGNSTGVVDTLTGSCGEFAANSLRAQAVLEQLESMLVTDDTTAAVLFQTNRPLLLATLGASAIQQLERQMTDFDYPAALISLRGIMRGMPET